jgi:hypothetical protein
MGTSKKRQKALEYKRRMKAMKMRTPGAKSPYARKREYLRKNGGWGFDYGNPKPWK